MLREYGLLGTISRITSYLSVSSQKWLLSVIDKAIDAEVAQEVPLCGSHRQRLHEPPWIERSECLKSQYFLQPQLLGFVYLALFGPDAGNERRSSLQTAPRQLPRSLDREGLKRLCSRRVVTGIGRRHPVGIGFIQILDHQL